MTSSCNQSEEALAAALKADQGLQLRLYRGASETSDIFLEPGGRPAYMLGREPHLKGPWNYQLHLSSRLYSAGSAKGSEILRLKSRLNGQGVLELVGQGECPSTTLKWEGWQEGSRMQRRWVSGSQRWTFTFAGQAYVWTHRTKFTGDNMYCHEINGDLVASYTSRMWPRKLQGELAIEPKVQDLNLLHTLVASCRAYTEFHMRRTRFVTIGYS